MMNWQNIHLPFSAGLLQRSDPRAKPAPYLDIAHDIQFDQLGGVQTRYPYEALAAFVLDGGSLSSCRRLVNNDGELLLFTDVALFSWNAQLSKWVNKGTHLAVKVEEEPVFVTTGDQVDCDRAELGGVVLYTWVDGTEVIVAAKDKVTGSVLVNPTAIAGASRPRLVALDTKILLFYVEISTPNLKVKAIDPTAVATGIASAATTIVELAASLPTYDVVKIVGADSAALVARLAAPSTIRIAKVSSALGLTGITRARGCDGPIAVSCDPTGATLQVVRASGHSILGDRVTTSSLADEATDQAIGSIPADVFLGPTYVTYQIAAAHRSVTDGGQYRCYVFWHSGETDRPAVGGSFDLSWSAESNWVDTAGTIGTENDLFAPNLAVASRAFDHGGRVYVHVAFAGLSVVNTPLAGPSQAIPLQNTYFLLRDDGFVTAKIAGGRSGGFPPTRGRLPNVALTDGTATYSWCATERRIVAVEAKGRAAYADRGPRNVSLTFDSNEGRRCARLGPTLYIAGGGEVLQYDGTNLVEVGFHIYPWHFELIEVSSSPGVGEVEDGSYTYKPSWRWQNAVGDVDRSTTASINSLTITNVAAHSQSVQLLRVPPLTITHKGDAPTFELWRTAKNPTGDVPFFLVTSMDPASASAAALLISEANYYIANDATELDLIHLAQWSDYFADVEITGLPSNPENGSVLENLAPPPATIIVADVDRLYLAGIPGDPDRIWYSKQRNDGEVAAFHDELTAVIPGVGGDITALGFLNETLVAFRQTAIYAVPGSGFDNGGGGTNLGPARLLSSDVGAVNQESVVLTPAGLVFKSSKGWYLLNRGFSLEYIGAAVSDYDSETPLAAHLVETQHQVRILTQGPYIAPHLVDGDLITPVTARILVWNYPATPEEGRGQWAEWTISDAVHACIWNGAHVYLTDGGPLVQKVDYTSLTYGLDVETTWLKPLELQGEMMIDKLSILGELRSSDLTHLRVRIKYNYDDAAYVDDRYWPVSPTVVGGPLQLKIGPKRPRCESFKIRITAIARTSVIPDGGGAPVITNGPPTGEALKLTGLAMRVGAEQDLYNRLPAAQRS